MRSIQRAYIECWLYMLPEQLSYVRSSSELEALAVQTPECSRYAGGMCVLIKSALLNSAPTFQKGPGMVIYPSVQGSPLERNGFVRPFLATHTTPARFLNGTSNVAA